MTPVPIKRSEAGKPGGFIEPIYLVALTALAILCAMAMHLITRHPACWWLFVLAAAVIWVAVLYGIGLIGVWFGRPQMLKQNKKGKDDAAA